MKYIPWITIAGILIFFYLINLIREFYTIANKITYLT